VSPMGVDECNAVALARERVGAYAVPSGSRHATAELKHAPLSAKACDPIRDPDLAVMADRVEHFDCAALRLRFDDLDDRDHRRRLPHRFDLRAFEQDRPDRTEAGVRALDEDAARFESVVPLLDDWIWHLV